MTIELTELHDTAQKAFPADKLVPPRDAAWRLAVEMGWLMIELPESDGGLGLGPDASTAIHYEMGRVLSPAPLIPALLGLHAVVGAQGLKDRRGWIDRLCAGEYVPFPLLPARLEANSAGALTGTITGVLDADMASHVVAAASGRMLLVPLDAPGVEVVERPLWDKSRRIFDVVLSGYLPDASLVLAEDDAAEALRQDIDHSAQLALAADCLGGAEAAFALTVDYLKLRKQFDRPLAMFQSLKHRCADLKVLITAAQALLWARATDRSASPADIAALKAHASDVYAAVTEEMIQLHGGIGLTDEHHGHLFMKRAMLNHALWRSPDALYEITGRDCLANQLQ